MPRHPPKHEALDARPSSGSTARPLDHRRGRTGRRAARAALRARALGDRPDDKREGDGATPRRALSRPAGASTAPTACGGRRPALLRVPRSTAARRLVRRPRRPRYNRPVRLPYPARHERMWREDDLYDVVLDLAWNRGPIRKGRGSAIFLHCAKPGFTPTEGCVAVGPRAMARLAGADRAANPDRDRRLRHRASGRPVCGSVIARLTGIAGMAVRCAVDPGSERSCDVAWRPGASPAHSPLARRM